MVFYAIFWTTYVPFVLLTLSILAERLTRPAESNAATQVKPVGVSAKPSDRAHKEPRAAG
jgi:hypothetical protein